MSGCNKRTNSTRKDERLKMSASGYWCAVILLTFMQDTVGSHYEKKLLEVGKPKEYLRHQQNHRSSTFVDHKHVDPTEFRDAEIRSTLNSPAAFRSPIAEIAHSDALDDVGNRQVENRHATEIRPLIARNPVSSHFRPTEIYSEIPSTRNSDSENRLRAENCSGGNRSNLLTGAKMRLTGNRRDLATRSVEVLPTSERYIAEIAPGIGTEKVRATSAQLRLEEKRPTRIRSPETRSQAEDRRPAKEISSTDIRPMEIFWTEIEQAEASNIERSQIRHGRSRSHFARQKMEDASKDGLKNAVNRIKTEDRENHFRTRQVEKANEFVGGSISLKRKHSVSRLLERNFSKDNSVNSQSSDRTENNVSEELESLLKLYQTRKENVTEESSLVPLTSNLSWLIEQNFFKNTSATDRLPDQIKNDAQNQLEDIPKAHYSGNLDDSLRTNFDSLKSFLKDDPLSKLRKVLSLNKTITPTAVIDHNTNETIGIDLTEDTSESFHDLEDEVLQDVALDYSNYEESSNTSDRSTRKRPNAAQVDIVTRFLRIIENQHTLGENCTAGTDLNLGEGVVDQYAQERFRLEAELAVNRANMLTRLWKYAPDVMLSSEYLLHASVLSMVEFDEDIFAAGNCYDKLQYRDRWLYCPFAHRLPNQDGILVKDLAIQYKYLSNSSEWFYIARKNAERVIASYEQFSRGIYYTCLYYLDITFYF